MKKRICIVGLTLTGNKGAESMLTSIMHNMESLAGDLDFDLITVYPSQDAAREKPKNLRLVSGRPLTMLALLPITLLLYPLLRMGPVRTLLRKHPVCRSFMDADLVADCSGVAFVEGRGFPLLMYNMSLCVPAKLLGTRVIKLAQAMGPFNSAMNRVLSRWALAKLDTVVARGAITARNLDELKLANTHTCADTAFTMPILEGARKEAEKYIPELAQGVRTVGISPSIVVDDYCRAHNIDYAGVMAQFIRHVQECGFGVVLIPHSIRPEGKKRMNNDLLICRDIVGHLDEDSSVTLIEDDLHADELRELIGHMDFFVASRFHSMVSALAMKVPTLLIGWSHKYLEVMDMFALEEWAMGFEDVSVDKLTEHFDRLVSEEDTIRTKLDRHLEEVRTSSMRNFELAVSLLDLRNGTES